MNKLPHALVVAVVSILFGANAHAANLVQNPGFDTTTNWTLTTSGSITYDSSNGQPAPSALVAAPDNSSFLEVEVDSDCIVITAQNADLYADIQVHAGSASVAVNAFSNADCTVYLGLAGSTSPAPPASIWGTVSSLNFALPPGTQSAIVTLLPYPNSDDGSPGSASFDNIRFGPSGTTPVRLQSFNVD